MKWMPLTDDTLKQLEYSGYTHLVVKSITPAEQDEHDKKFVTLEAVKNRIDGSEVFEISSHGTSGFAEDDTVDYYVFFK